MLPLNRPLYTGLQRPDSSFDLLVEIKNEFPEYYPQLVFSARQGLELIYADLFNTYGRCKVAVSPLTCFEALFPIIRNGHEIVYIDIDEYTLNMDEKLIPPDVSVIQAIHFGGNPQDMNEICKHTGIIVEDCAQAYGASYCGKPVGSMGHFSVFSFYKNLSALGGGLILSREKKNWPAFPAARNSVSMYRRLKRWLEVRTGINSRFCQWMLTGLLLAKQESTNVNISTLGINSVIQDTIVKQFYNRRLLLQKRREAAGRILAGIDPAIMRPQQAVVGATPVSTRLLFILKKMSTREAVKKLRAKGIGANHLTQSHLQPYQRSVFEEEMLKPQDTLLPAYCRILDRVLAIPISPALRESEIETMVQIINQELT